MAYLTPRYIAAARIDDAVLRFKWDDWRASEDFEYDSDHVVARLANVSLRSRIALGIGIYEWIIWRFRSVLTDRTPFQIAEGAWCAIVHRDYMTYFELEREDWLGPIRGPLWCAVTWLIPMLFCGDNDPEECESGLAYLPRLAMHVLPDQVVFETWLERCIERLVRTSSLGGADPFEDPFSEREEERRGPLVAREALDPEFVYDPSMAGPLLSSYLRAIDYRSNPLLRSPSEMAERGFRGTPYSL